VIAPPQRLPGLLGGLALCAGVAEAAPPVSHLELESKRWQDRVYLVVADAGPMRVPFKQFL